MTSWRVATVRRFRYHFCVVRVEDCSGEASRDSFLCDPSAGTMLSQEGSINARIPSIYPQLFSFIDEVDDAVDHGERPITEPWKKKYTGILNTPMPPPPLR